MNHYPKISTLVLSVGSVLFIQAASASTLIFTEGFNSGFSSPYSDGFGIRYGITAPGIVLSPNSGTVATEGDAFAGMNSSQTNTTPTVISGMDIDLGTVTEEGTTYIFTGEFGWRFGSVAAASDLAFNNGQTGFRIGTDTKKDGVVAVNFGEDFTAGVFNQVSFSYTTVIGDVGQDLGLRIRLQDNGAVSGLTQLLTDNWQVTSIPEPSAGGALIGIGSLALLTLRRHRIRT
ncbi:MAG: hypothetical protein AAGJ81_04220 [Verrucomicrobiota bacterium]